MTTKNWFESRGLKVLDYQQKAIADVQQSMLNREITVLAASPTAGKTFMTICIIDELFQKNPNAKVLILAHGTEILRSQFHNDIEDINNRKMVNFTYGCAKTCGEYHELSKTKNVVITIPQTLKHCKSIEKIDLIIVDEAHEFYFAENKKRNNNEGMVKSIIKKSGAKKQLLLTGTPSEFVLNKFHIIPVALNTVYNEGRVSEFYVKLASSNYNFEYDDFNRNCELNSEKRFKCSDTEKTLNNLIKKIVEYLKSLDHEFINLIPEWLPTLKRLKKTMIVCKSQPQAKQVQKYFEKIGVNSVLSISDTDDDTSEIKRFKIDNDILVLIVVGRGVLGFNYPELVNIVDLKMSHNLNVVYQLLCRIARPHPNGDKKMFFKLAPQMLTDYYQHIMNAVCMLMHDEYFLKFNGKNFKDMEVPVKRINTKKRIGENKTKNKQKTKKYEPIDMGNLPVMEFFKSLYHKKGELLNIYAMTTINDIRAEFLNHMPKGYWTLEKCKENALNYKTVSEWYENNSGALSAARDNGWFEDCTKHMPKQIRYTKEECVEDALKYNLKYEWLKNSPNLYQAANKHGWLEDCTKHMKKQIIRTLEVCKADALKYKTRNEWQKKDGASYKKAQTEGWLDECCAHMPNRKRWTKEDCINDAKKYDNLNDWSKFGKGAICAAKKFGIYDKCIAHMYVKKFAGYWYIKENCLEDAKKYNSLNEWTKLNQSAVNAARANGWLDECCAHMLKKEKI